MVHGRLWALLSCLPGLPSLPLHREPSPPRAVQLIHEDGCLDRRTAERHFALSGLASAGLSYRIVGIVGPQSSGKSSLLNSLFDTSFSVMSASDGRSRTTRGVWAQVSPSSTFNHTLLLDLQGTDSREAGEAGKRFERQVGLLALALSDVLCINLFEHDVGRLEGSSLSLLQTILELSLELKRGEHRSDQHPSRVTLLFIVRDFVPEGGTPLPVLSAQLREHVSTVWANVWKGEGEDELGLEELFDVQVAAMPHLRLQPLLWEQEVGALAARFGEGEDSVFQDGGAPASGVPADALCELTSRVWERICANELLHLPTQQRLVAEFRCKQLADAELLWCKSRLRRLRAEIFSPHNQPFDKKRPNASPLPSRTFRRRVRGALVRALRRLEASTSRYETEVVEVARRRLQEGEWQLLRPLAVSQLDAIAREAAARFEQLASEGGRGEGEEVSGEWLRRARRQCISQYERAASACLPAAELGEVVAASWAERQKASRRRLFRLIDRAEAHQELALLQRKLYDSQEREAFAVSALSAAHRAQIRDTALEKLPNLAAAGLLEESATGASEILPAPALTK